MRADRRFIQQFGRRRGPGRPKTGVAILAGGLLLASAAAVAEPLVIEPDFRVGRQFTIEVRSERQGSRMDGGSTTTATVVVEESGDAGALLRWTWGATEFDDPAVASNPIMAAAANALGDVVFEIRTNELGQYAGLRNEAEIAQKLEAMLEGMIGTMASGIEDEQQREGFVTMMRRVMSPAVMMQTATKQVQLLLTVSGVEVDSEEAILYEYEAPNPLGGEPLKGQMVAEVEDVDEATGILTIGVENVFDPRLVRQMVLGLVGPALQGQAEEAEIEQSMPSFELVDRTEVVVDPAEGWPRSVRHERTIQAGDRGRVDTTILKISATAP